MKLTEQKGTLTGCLKFRVGNLLRLYFLWYLHARTANVNKPNRFCYYVQKGHGFRENLVSVIVSAFLIFMFVDQLLLLSCTNHTICVILIRARLSFTRTGFAHCGVRSFKLLERFRCTFTPNGKREFVPRDQVSPLIVGYCLLLLHRNKKLHTSFIHKNCSG